MTQTQMSRTLTEDEMTNILKKLNKYIPLFLQEQLQYCKYYDEFPPKNFELEDVRQMDFKHQNSYSYSSTDIYYYVKEKIDRFDGSKSLVLTIRIPKIVKFEARIYDFTT